MTDYKFSDPILSQLKKRQQRLLSRRKPALVGGRSRRVKELDATICSITMLVEGGRGDDSL